MKIFLKSQFYLSDFSVKMSTSVTQTHVTKVVPKTIAKLKTMDEKRPLNRSTSIETIKRINTYICSPQSYLLPAILTTWLKTGQKSLHSSAEKTIFMFRSVIFGSFLLKFLLRDGSKGQPDKLDLQFVLSQVAKRAQGQSQNPYAIALAFKLAVVLMTVQMCLCAFYLTQCLIPLGLAFLLVSTGYIIVLGHRLNAAYLMKHDVKSKIL